jgi:putative ABC transport system permease protein
MAMPSRRPLPITLLRALLPLAERDEIAADLAGEYESRCALQGNAAATGWLWTQLLRSVPSLLLRIWHRGRTGFDPRANAMNPGGPLVERWILEARYAARRLRTRPTYATLAVLTLALGVGGMAAIAGIVRPLLVDPLPYPNDRQLAQFWSHGDWEAREFATLRDQWTGFIAVAAYRPKDATMERDGAPTRLVPGVASSSELFRVLDVKPLLGRTFAAGEDTPEAAPVVVLGNAVWRSLGGDPAIVGSRIKVDGVSRTVIGVMPRGFWFPDPSIGVWIPDVIKPASQIGMYTLVGRVSAGHNVDAMQPVIDRAARTLRSRYTYSPQSDKTKHPMLTSLRAEMVGGMRPALLATLAGMIVILLIACANVAALVLGQVESRSRELALRLALGADRTRLATQLMLEVLVLAVIAGVIGTGLAAAGFAVLRNALASGAWSERATLDWSLLAMAMIVAVCSALGIASLPIVALWRGELRATMAGTRANGVIRKRGGLQSLMVVTEVALAVLLACGAALLGRSVTKLYAIRPGIDTRGVAVIDIAIPANLNSAQRHTMMASVLRELSALPGVHSVGSTQKLPIRGGGWTMGLRIVDETADVPSPYFRMVSRDYFSTLGIPVRRGRAFDGSERASDSIVTIVVNESLVRVFYPTINPVGQIMPGGFGHPERIVGVVADVAEGNLRDAPAPARYYLADQIDFVPDGQAIVLKTASPEDAQRILPAARRTIGQVAPAVAVQEATTMQRVFDRAVGPARPVMGLFALLTGIALLLGAIGVYGVISQFVARRHREWSIRVALGLSPARVVSLVVRHGAALVAMGIAVGIAGAIISAKLLSAFLYGISTTDPVAIVAAAVTLLTVGLIAALVPALRAGRSDPALVLREQ